MPRVDHILDQIAELDTVSRESLETILFQHFPFSHRLMSNRWESYFQEFPSIVTTPDVCGGSARLIRSRIPVWTLERMRQLGVSEIDILRSFPTLRAIDLVQAFAYATRYRNEIETAIRENEDESADERNGVNHTPGGERNQTFAMAK